MKLGRFKDHTFESQIFSRPLVTEHFKATRTSKGTEHLKATRTSKGTEHLKATRTSKEVPLKDGDEEV